MATSLRNTGPGLLKRVSAGQPLAKVSRSSICQQCRLSIQKSPELQSLNIRPQYRAFTNTSYLCKKSSASKKSPRKSPEVTGPDVDEHVPDNKATQERDAEVDPYDYSELQTGIDNAIAHLKDALSKTRDAGRVSVEMVEQLPLDLNVKGADTRGGSAHKDRTRIGDIASVVPKGGRQMQVFAAEEGHLKPLTSAIQGSPYSLAPQPDAQNPLLLTFQVPPATAETRKQAAVEAKKCFDKASLDVRNARGDAQKRFRKMELQKLVIKDELRKAHAGMEDVAKKGQDEVKKVYEAALRALEKS